MEVYSIDNQREILKYLEEYGKIDLPYIKEQIEMNKRQTILNDHPYKIWFGKDGYWHSYLIGDDGKLKHKKRKNQNDIENDIINYYISKKQEPKFRAVYAEWIKEKEECGELEKNSITRYDNAFEQFFPLDEPFCDIKLCKMTDGDLERFIKKSIKKHSLTKKSYGMLTVLLNGVFKFAKRQKYTDFNISIFFGNFVPNKKLFTRKHVDKKKEVFTRKEARMLIEYFQKNPTIINMGLTLAFLTGVRVGELCTLKKEDNIEKNFLAIRRTEVIYKDKETNKYVTSIKESPKGDDYRVIDIPKKAQIVIEQIKLMNPHGEFLFMDEHGRIREKRFNYYLKKACVEIGIPVRTTHKMRKTYGSNLLEKNIGEALVQNQLGHKQISTTHNFYHYDITEDDERSEMINTCVVY